LELAHFYADQIVTIMYEELTTSPPAYQKLKSAPLGLMLETVVLFSGIITGLPTLGQKGHRSRSHPPCGLRHPGASGLKE